jgi:hypothetical protein
MTCYIGLELWVGHRLSIWRIDLLTDTIIWFVASALVLFFNINEATKDRHFFRRRAAEVIGITAVIEFLVNFYVFSLPAELVLQAFLIVVALLSAFAGTQHQYRSVKKFIERLLALAGFSIFAYVIFQVLVNWAELDKEGAMLQLALPVWLTLGMLPFIYALSVYVIYDWAFRGINWATDDRRERWRARVALATKFHLRTRQLRSFSWAYLRQVASAPSLKASRRAIDDQIHAAARRRDETF